MRPIVRVWLGAAMLLCGVPLAHARPNFSGTWKLNAAKSNFGAIRAPALRIDKISHKGPLIEDSFTQSGQRGEQTAHMKYSTDGRETTNILPSGEIKTKARWEGNYLVIDGQTGYNGASVILEDRWSLSADGRTLTIQRHVNSPRGETDQLIVLEKQ